MSPSEIVLYIENQLELQNKTKAQFYAATEVSAAMFSNWRKEKNRPSLDALDRVNDFLGTSFTIALDDLTPSLSPDALRIAEAFNRADEKSRRIVMDVLLEYMDRPQGKAAVS